MFCCGTGPHSRESHDCVRLTAYGMGAPSNAKWKRLGSLSKQDNSRQRIGNAHSVPHWKKKKQAEITEKKGSPAIAKLAGF